MPAKDRRKRGGPLFLFAKNFTQLDQVDARNITTITTREQIVEYGGQNPGYTGKDLRSASMGSVLSVPERPGSVPLIVTHHPLRHAYF
eukprot:642295-Rhodomonas_salina.2